MQFIEVRRIALGNVEGIKTLINLEHVRYIEEGSGCLYVYFKEDSARGARCLWFIDDVGDERCVSNLDEKYVVGACNHSAYYLNHDLGDTTESNYLIDARTLIATIRKYNFNGDQIKAYLQGLIDSFEAHKEDVYDMVDSALERWYGLGEVTEDQYDELRELADLILTIDFGGC